MNQKSLKFILFFLLQNSLDKNAERKSISQLIQMVHLIKTADAQHEFLSDFIQLHSNGETIKLIVGDLLKKLKELASKDQLDFDHKLIAQECVRIIQICDLHKAIVENRDEVLSKLDQITRESVEEQPDVHELVESQLVGWSGKDAARLVSLLAYRGTILKHLSSDTVEELRSQISTRLTINEMLHHFTLHYSHLVKRNGTEVYDNLPLELVLMNCEQSGFNQVSLQALSTFLFSASFLGDQENLVKLLHQACLYPSNLLLLLFTSWLNTGFSFFWKCWPYACTTLLKIVDSMNDSRLAGEEGDEEEGEGEGKAGLFLDDSTSYDDRLLAPNWSDIIEMVYQSDNITSALVAVNMIKSLVNRFKLNRDDLAEMNLDQDGEQLVQDSLSGNAKAVETKSLSSNNADNEWETLHLDKENLCLLTKQLEDLFLLDMLLKSNLSTLKLNQDSLHSGQASGSNKISLAFILMSGPGIVSEIVARWVVNHKIEPDWLLGGGSAEAGEDVAESLDRAQEVGGEEGSLRR